MTLAPEVPLTVPTPSPSRSFSKPAAVTVLAFQVKLAEAPAMVKRMAAVVSR